MTKKLKKKNKKFSKNSKVDKKFLKKEPWFLKGKKMTLRKNSTIASN